ncbi:hypothetical protein NKH77_07145 [Streptomyces sp. M19]
MTDQFEADRTYDNVYFVFVDTSGTRRSCCAIPGPGRARLRPAARADARAARAVLRPAPLRPQRPVVLARRRRVLRDPRRQREHRARRGPGRRPYLPRARPAAPAGRVRAGGVHGELHVRMAVHKGTIRHTGEGRTGLIHSPTSTPPRTWSGPRRATAWPSPRTCIARRAARRAVHGGRQPRGQARPPDGRGRRQRSGHATRAWLAGHGLAGAPPCTPTPSGPARRRSAAAGRGGAGGGRHGHRAARLLQQAGHHRAARPVPGRGPRAAAAGRYVQLLSAGPSSDAAATLARQHREDMSRKIKDSLERFGRFKDRYGAEAEGLRVYQTDEFPGFSALGIDMGLPDGLILYSSYLMGTSPYG